MKRSTAWYFLLLVFIAFCAVLSGCGGSATDDLAGSNIVTNTNNNVTLTGYIRDGSIYSQRTSANRFGLSLSDLSGIIVFLENNKNLYGTTDFYGKYSIPNVPQGKHTLVAEKRFGNQIQFRARQENIQVAASNGESEVILSNTDSTQVLSMQQSNYSLTLTVTDNNGVPLPLNSGLKVNLWGTDYVATYTPGVIKLTDFPSIQDTKATISAIGYKTTVIPVTFGENYNSEIYVKLPKTTEDSNLAPIVAITYDTDYSTINKDINDILTIYPNKRLFLNATGFDANGDYITYTWSATSGNLDIISPTRVSFIATETYKNVIIILTGIDRKNAVGKAELFLNVYGGTTATSTPDPYNPPPATYTPDPATGTPDPYNPPPATYTPDPATGTSDIGTGTTDIGTGTTDIGTGTTDIGTGTTDIGTGTTDIGTGTTDIGTGTTDIGTGTTDIGTGTTDIGTGTTDIGTGTTDIGTGTTDIGTGTTDIGTGTTDIGTGTTDIGTGTTDIGSGTQDIGSGTQDIGSGTQDIGSGTQDIGSGTQDIGSGTQDIGSGTQDIGSGTQDIGSGTQDIGSGTHEIGSGSQDIGSGSSHPF